MKKVFMFFAVLLAAGINANAQMQFVDLGLSVLWGSCNLGAYVPWQYGDYYAWGETTTKSEYTSKNCATFGKTFYSLLSEGIMDRNYNLTANHDAAQVLGKGRMPTWEETKELREKCRWEWYDSKNTKYNGVSGWELKSNINGNSIFIPASGYYSSPSQYSEDGLYSRGASRRTSFFWTSSVFDYYDTESQSNHSKWLEYATKYAYVFKVNMYYYEDYRDDYNFAARYYGLPIRPVKDKNNTSQKRML